MAKKFHVIPEEGADRVSSSLAALQEACLQLEAKGLIVRTGEYRNGRPVFVAVEHVIKH